jgi:predicted negative regulator of RcsB-dependent stress response
VNRRLYTAAAAVIAAVIAICGATVILPLMMFGQAQANAAACYDPRQVAGQQLTAEQMANAQTIVATTQARGLPEYAAVVALAVAKQESDLVNSR